MSHLRCRKSILPLGLLAVIAVVGVVSPGYAQQPFGGDYFGVTPVTGEVPLLVFLLGPDDPSYKQLNVYGLRMDGHIHLKIKDPPQPYPGGIFLRAHNGHYVVAENGGGGEVNAKRNAAEDFAKFSLIDINGDTLMSGDKVRLRTKDKKHYLIAHNGGGGFLKAHSTYEGNWETLKIWKFGGGRIRHGDKVCFQTHNGNYIVAEGGGGGTVNANRMYAGPFETFTLMCTNTYHEDITLPQTRTFKSRPAVSNSPDGHLQNVVALGTDGFIYSTINSVFHDDSEWRPWNKLPGTTQFAFGPAMINSPDGHLASVFATGQDGYIYQIVYSRQPTSQWGDWQKLPGTRKFKSAPAAINSPDGATASVFATSLNGYVYQIDYNRGPGSHWGPWTKLPGTQKFKSAPTVTNTPDGSLTNVFATGVDGYVYSILHPRGPGAQWGQWKELPGTQKFKSAPTAVNTANGEQAVVFALGEDNRCYEISYARGPGSGWGGWVPIAGNNIYASAPAATCRLARKKSVEYYRDILFGPNDSIRGYFLENSYEAFTYKEAYISPWLAAKDDPSTTDWDESSLKFIHEYDSEEKKSTWVVQQIERMTPFRFKDYDSNNDGKVTRDELAILWIYPGDGHARGRGFDPAVVSVPSLSIGVEMRALIRGGATMSVKTVAHELGHQTLGLGDLYPQVGRLSLMGSESAYSHLDPWSKIKLGWIQARSPAADGKYTLPAVETNPKVYVLFDPDGKGSKEYFILENRWPSDSYEKNLPTKGLAIWHIDESHTDPENWARKTIHLLSPLEDKLEFWDGSDPSKSYDLTADSSPANSRWFDGTPSGISISNISEAGSTMSFYVDIP